MTANSRQEENSKNTRPQEEKKGQKKKKKLTPKIQRRQVLAAPRRRQRLKTAVRHALIQPCVSFQPLVGREGKKTETGSRVRACKGRDATRRRGDAKHRESQAQRKRNTGRKQETGEEKDTHREDTATSGSRRTPPPPALEDCRPSRLVPALRFIPSSCQQRERREIGRRESACKERGTTKRRRQAEGAKRSTEETQGHRKKIRHRRKRNSHSRCSDARFSPHSASASA